MASTAVVYHLIARDSASRTFSKVGRSADAMGGRTSKASRAIAVAGKVAAGAAVGIGLVGASVIKAGVDYEKSLNTFQAVSKATRKEMDAVRTKAKALGSDMDLPATSAADAALAMTELAKGNLSVKASMAASKGVLALSAAGQLEVADAATITADALNAFRLKGNKATHVADLLANSANASTGEVSDMAQALQMSSAVYSKAGLKIEDLTTGISLMANAGIKGSDAGTSMKTALLKLQNPSSEAAATMKELGIDIYDAQGNMKPFRAIIDEVSSSTKGLTQKQKDQKLATIFGSDAIRAANTVLANGTDAYDKMRRKVVDGSGALKVAKARTKGVGGAWEALKSQVETAQIEIFEKIAPLVDKLLRGAATAIPVAMDAVGKLVGAITGGSNNATDSVGRLRGGLEKVHRKARDELPTKNFLAQIKARAKGGSGELSAMARLVDDAKQKWNELQAFLFGRTRMVRGVEVKDDAALGIVDRLAGAVRNQDWSKFGSAVADAIRGAISGQLHLTRMLERLADQIDWVRIGERAAEGAPAFVAGLAKGIFNAITGRGSKGGMSLTRWIKAGFVIALGPIPYVVGKAARGIGKGIVLGAVKGFWSNVTDLKDRIVDGFWRAWRAVKSWLGISSPSKRFAAIGRQIVEGAIRGVLGKLDGLADVAGRIGRRVIGAVSGAAGWLKDKGANAVRGLISGIFSKMDSLGTAVSGLKSKIVGGLKGAGSWLKNTGGNVVSGLAGGIKGAAGGAKNAAVGVGKGIYGGVRNFFGMRSPSRLMARVGNNLMIGLGKGITAKAGMPKKAMLKTGDQSVASFNKGFKPRSVIAMALNIFKKFTGHMAKIPGPLGRTMDKAHEKVKNFRRDFNRRMSELKGKTVTAGVNLNAGAKQLLSKGFSSSKVVSLLKQERAMARRAFGGAIRGPGGETADRIPALLSNNEHVWSAREVRGAGGH
ncbi:MAG: phage tail tape measure protein, partial [Actinomycetes bacterium]